jgi:hypothetical protein
MGSETQARFEDVLEAAKRVCDVDDPDDPGVRYCALCLASAIVGADRARVAEFTGYDRAFVDPAADRLEAAGVWRDGRVHANWFAEDEGGLALLMDSLVAQGLATRAPVPPKGGADAR